MTAVRTPFRFHIDGTDAAPVLRLHGDADLSAAVALRRCLRGLLDDGASTVTVDVADVDHLCPSAARAIADAGARLGERVGIIGDSTPVDSVLAALGLA